MLLILISIHFIVRPCLYSFIVTSFVLKGLRRRHQVFFWSLLLFQSRVRQYMYYDKKNAYVLLKTSGRHMQHVWIRIIFREVFKE